jgi:hypothetical protein
MTANKHVYRTISTAQYLDANGLSTDFQVLAAFQPDMPGGLTTMPSRGDMITVPELGTVEVIWAWRTTDELSPGEARLVTPDIKGWILFRLRVRRA